MAKIVCLSTKKCKITDCLSTIKNARIGMKPSPSDREKSGDSNDIQGVPKLARHTDTGGRWTQDALNKPNMLIEKFRGF